MKPNEAQSVDRALARLSAGAELLSIKDGASFGVFPRNDKRRRPLVRLSAKIVRQMEGSGALVRGAQGQLKISDAGRARVRRDTAGPEEGYLAQHAGIEDRVTIDKDGRERRVRAVGGASVVKRLAALCDGDGQPWLGEAELHAAAKLRADWEFGEVGIYPASNWAAPPIGNAPRSVGNAAEGAMGARYDARRRVATALDRLAPMLRSAVVRICLHDDGVEALERAEKWPARSGKLALKLGLAQLVISYPA